MCLKELEVALHALLPVLQVVHLLQGVLIVFTPNRQLLFEEGTLHNGAWDEHVLGMLHVSCQRVLDRQTLRMGNPLVHVGVQVPDPWAIVYHELQVPYKLFGQHVIREVQGLDLVVRKTQQMHEKFRCEIPQFIVREVQLPHGLTLFQAGHEGSNELVS